MPDRRPASPGYKALTLGQMRSFCETGRRGSLTAAAQELDLAHPTVWQQVHSLESLLGVKLVEASVRGCRLTDAGRVLFDWLDPLVVDLDRLRERFADSWRRLANRLVLSAPARILMEDMPESLRALQGQFPELRVELRPAEDASVPRAVESGEADLGLTGTFVREEDHPLLSCRRCYEVDVALITPKNHPLARKARVRPADLLPYPIVNSAESFRDPAINLRLQECGLLDGRSGPVEGGSGMVVRRYVELGYGIGLIGLSPRHHHLPGLHHRSMSEFFGTVSVYLVARKQPKRKSLVNALSQWIRTRMSPGGMSRHRLERKGRGRRP
jgi:molybdate transport repressor ModE-like protein